jgi:hypothetical protein
MQPTMQGSEGVDGLLGVLSLGLDRDFRAMGGSQREHLEDALGVGLALPVAGPDRQVGGAAAVPLPHPSGASSWSSCSLGHIGTVQCCSSMM